MFFTICKYIYASLIIGYGVFLSIEDYKDKSIHAFPTMLAAILFLPIGLISMNTPWLDKLITVICALIVLGVFDHFGLWGKGDTKMLSSGLLLTFWFLNPLSAGASLFLFTIYVFVLSCFGLITALILQDKKPPMAHCFLLTNISMIVLSIIFKFS